MTATAVSEAGGGSFCVGVARKASIAGRAARRLRARGDALRRNRAKRSQSRDVQRIGRVRAKGLQQLKPGKTCFGSCRGKPLSNVSDEAKPPPNAKRGRTRRSSLSWGPLPAEAGASDIPRSRAPGLAISPRRRSGAEKMLAAAVLDAHRRAGVDPLLDDGALAGDAAGAALQAAGVVEGLDAVPVDLVQGRGADADQLEELLVVGLGAVVLGQLDVRGLRRPRTC